MDSRRLFIQKIAAGSFTLPLVWSGNVYAGDSPEPVWQPPHLHHFPSRLYAFVFRLWDQRPVDVIARFLKTTPENVTALALDLGLPPQTSAISGMTTRYSFSAIFQVWDIIPQEEIINLVGMTYEEFYDFLHTDITLWYWLGAQPEGLTPLVYEAPAPEEREKAKKFREWVYSTIPEDMLPLEEEPRGFIEHLNNIHAKPLAGKNTSPGPGEISLDDHWTLRYPVGSGIVAENAVKDFMKFCEVVMGESIAASHEEDISTIPPKSIVLSLIPGEFKDPESHHLEIGPEEVAIRASDERGLMRGLYFLEDEMKLRRGMILPLGTFHRETLFTPRYVFSYYDKFGNMLKESEGEFYRESYLQYISHFGVNGIWLQCILSELVPTGIFPEFGKESAMEIERLNGLIERARRWGMNVYLYFNEPRGRTEDFYKKHPACRGGYAKSRQGYAMCTSAPEVQEYLVSAFRDLFRLAPGLAGVFVITASENLTTCYSNSAKTDCPRCGKRTAPEVTAEVINLINRGVRMSNPEAEVIAWDWSWHGVIEKDPQAETVRLIDPSVILRADFERGVKTTRGGIEIEINEYCLSVVGPSPRAISRAEQARAKGTKIYAKLNLSNTCEMSAVPYMPVPLQVARKFENMRKYGFNGAMESWGGGGYPSINFEAANEFTYDPVMTAPEAVRRVALRHYGPAIAESVAAIWEKLTDSFSSCYPFSVPFVYNSPVNSGPACNIYFNPLPKPYGNTTILNPKDDNNWGTNVFPPPIMIDLLQKMASDWGKGAEELRRIFEDAGIAEDLEIRKEMGVVEAIAMNFQSAADHTRFNIMRNEMHATADVSRKKELLEELEDITRMELDIAKRYYAIVRIDSRIGAKPVEIIEKIANCRYILEHHIPEFRKMHNI